MPKSGMFEQMAREAAERVDRQRELGEQLVLLPDEAPVEVDQAPARGGRRGADRAKSQMRQWLEHRGYQVPEEKLAQMAGLASREDAVLVAMQTAERVIAWAFDVDEVPKGAARIPSPQRRLDTFLQLYTIQLRALDALMPYGAAKVTADVAVNQTTNVIVPAGPAREGDGARVVNPDAGARMAPPPMPQEIQRNQRVAGDDTDDADGEGWT